MKYTPIKNILLKFFGRSPLLRKIFYRLMDLLLLRSWYIHQELRAWLSTASPHAAILDAGCGPGQYTYWLLTQSPFLRITGIDIDETHIAQCRQFFQQINKSTVEFYVADLSILKLHNTFDLVLSVDVIEHIADDVTVLSNIYQSLKKGGMLLLSTPSDQGGSDVDVGTENTPFIEEHVRNGYSRAEMEQKLQQAGFTKIDIRYSYGPPGRMAWKLSMKYPLLLLNCSKLFFLILPLYYLFTYPLTFLLNYIDLHSSHVTGTGLIVKAWKL